MPVIFAGAAAAAYHANRREGPPMNMEDHIQKHKQLHDALDELIADYMKHNKTKRPSTTTVTELMQWSHQQCENPTE